MNAWLLVIVVLVAGCACGIKAAIAWRKASRVIDQARHQRREDER